MHEWPLEVEAAFNACSERPTRTKVRLMFGAYLVSHGVAVITVIASALTMARLLQSRRTPQSTFAWLLGLVFVPFLAIPLFFALGSRKFPKRAKGVSREPSLVDTNDDLPPGCIARVLRNSGVAPPRSGNTFEILPTGVAAYARLIQLIEGAEQSIDLTIFILGEDTTGNAIIAALAARAKHGVRVRVIVDGVGSARSARKATSLLQDVGAELRVFMPLRHSPFRGRTNLRSHRKLAVFDRLHVFSGGMNLANEYMGLPIDDSAEPRWRDVAAVTSGPIAKDAEALFESDWVFCGGTKRVATDRVADTAFPTPGEELVQVVPSGPDMITDTMYDLLLTGIFAAKKRVVVVTPYYVPDELLQHSLVLAARRGVRTELLVPSQSNHRMADMARGRLLRELREAGVVIHYYPKGMVHAKAVVLDDTFAYVGSPNFDMRSLFLNYENALCVYSPEAIARVLSFVDGLIEECTFDGPPEDSYWVIEQIARLLAPEL
jgi:cardiolipin synthase A/B